MREPEALCNREKASFLAPSSGWVKHSLTMRCTLIKEFRFEAAQTLPTAPEGHKCKRMHGHSFKIEIAVTGTVDPAIGWVYDHAEIGKAMNPLMELLDHSYLNEVPGLENPTIENMCAWFWRKLEPQLPGLSEIILYETPTARCVFRGFND